LTMTGTSAIIRSHMTTYRSRRPNYTELAEYELAVDLCKMIQQVVADMSWTINWEWLKARLLGEAERLKTSLAEGYQSELVAEWALGVGSCRNSVLMADYVLTFLRGQGMLEPAKADPILNGLKQLMSGLVVLSENLRAELTQHRRAQLI
jgi:hypothetical protein